jgi:hypothetical protein
MGEWNGVGNVKCEIQIDNVVQKIKITRCDSTLKNQLACGRHSRVHYDCITTIVFEDSKT